MTHSFSFALNLRVKGEGKECWPTGQGADTDFRRASEISHALRNSLPLCQARDVVVR